MYCHKNISTHWDVAIAKGTQRDMPASVDMFVCERARSRNIMWAFVASSVRWDNLCANTSLRQPANLLNTAHLQCKTFTKISVIFGEKKACGRSVWMSQSKKKKKFRLSHIISVLSPTTLPLAPKWIVALTAIILQLLIHIELLQLRFRL